MSTYDAYNLSLRDSTEFTVPTGGSSGDNITTCTFTLDTTEARSFQLLDIPNVYKSMYGSEDQDYEGAISPMIVVQTGQIYNLTVPLHDGMAVIGMPGSGNVYLTNLSANISEIEWPLGYAYAITGDASAKLIDYNYNVN